MQTFEYPNLVSWTDEPHAWAPAEGEVWPR